jgi:hypothetical protein
LFSADDDRVVYIGRIKERDCRKDTTQPSSFVVQADCHTHHGGRPAGHAADTASGAAAPHHDERHHSEGRAGWLRMVARGQMLL